VAARQVGRAGPRARDRRGRRGRSLRGVPLAREEARTRPAARRPCSNPVGLI